MPVNRKFTENDGHLAVPEATSRAPEKDQEFLESILKEHGMAAQGSVVYVTERTHGCGIHFGKSAPSEVGLKVAEEFFAARKKSA